MKEHFANERELHFELYRHLKNWTRQEWIEYLVKQKAVPVWSDDVEGNVYFRRLTRPTSKAEELVWGKHIMDGKTRQRVAEILGIVTKADCKMVRDLIKERIFG